jgi:hypothetical protein
MTFESIIKENRPNISLSSIKTYLSNIKSIAKAINQPINSVDDIVKHNEEIFKFLEDQKLNVRKTKLSAFIVVLDKGKGKNDDTIDKILIKFRKQITEDGATYEKEENKQELTDSQKENFIPWDDVMKIYNNLKTEAEPLLKLERLTLNQFKKLQNYILLSLYILIPPRRSLDYADFKIRNIKEGAGGDNYMTIKKSGRKKVPIFVFNRYKNSSRLGPQEIEIPLSLKNLVSKWIDKNPYEYLIVNGKGNHITQSKINDMLNDIFGKRIGSSMLRHIYLTKKYGDIDLAEMKETTEAMGSSNIDRTLKYVSKKDG